MLIKTVRVVNEPTHRGTLKLFTEVNFCSGVRQLCRRLPLATYHGIELSADHNLYVEEFKDFNPAFAEVDISYEFVLRKFG